VDRLALAAAVSPTPRPSPLSSPAYVLGNHCSPSSLTGLVGQVGDEGMREEKEDGDGRGGEERRRGLAAENPIPPLLEPHSRLFTAIH
jgi:hypothetical protein